eukprot:353000-Chlamydomonas_euryale.AAC.8
MQPMPWTQGRAHINMLVHVLKPTVYQQWLGQAMLGCHNWRQHEAEEWVAECLGCRHAFGGIILQQLCDQVDEHTNMRPAAHVTLLEDELVQGHHALHNL